MQICSRETLKSDCWISEYMLNFKLSNQKAQFVAREHEINRDVTPYVIN